MCLIFVGMDVLTCCGLLLCCWLVCDRFLDMMLQFIRVISFYKTFFADFNKSRPVPAPGFSFTLPQLIFITNTHTLQHNTTLIPNIFSYLQVNIILKIGRQNVAKLSIVLQSPLYPYSMRVQTQKFEKKDRH